MTGKNTAVYGIYRDNAQAGEAVDKFVRSGFRNEDISALLPQNSGSKDFAHERHSKAPEGAATGAVAGGAVGGALGVLVSLGTLAIPGLGPLIAAGPIVAALAGIGAGGTVGGLIGSLTGLGIPEYEAVRYEGRIKRGEALVSIHCDDSDWVKRAKDLMKSTGAEEISSVGEARADYANSDRPEPRARTSGGGLPA